MELRLASPDLGSIESEPGELLSFAVYASEVPIQGVGGLVDFRLASRLSKLWDGSFFGGHSGELLLTPGSTKLIFSHVLAVGLGERDPLLSQDQAYGHYLQVFRAHRHLDLTLLAIEPWLLGDDGALALVDAMDEASHVERMTLIGPLQELKKLLPRMLRKRSDLKVFPRAPT